jgi:hypothetical protein
MYQGFAYMMLTSVARSALVAGATYFVSVGVMPTSAEDGFVSAGLSIVYVGWAWWEKIGHAKVQAILAQVPQVEINKAAVKADVSPLPAAPIVKGEGR